MTPKVDRVLALTADRRFVDVTGPIGLWDSDEIGTTFWVTISQVGSDGSMVVASGASDEIAPGTKTWGARAEIAEGAQLAPGPATAFVTGIVRVSSSETPETYTWSVPTQLVVP